MQLCVRAESILALNLLAKEARSPKSGIVKNALFFPNHTPNLTLYRNPNLDPDPKTKKVPKVTLEILFERWTARSNYFYLEHRISHGCAKAARSADRQLVEIPGSSKALPVISLNYNPTLTLTLPKYPYPNLNLTLIQKRYSFL